MMWKKYRGMYVQNKKIAKNQLRAGKREIRTEKNGTIEKFKITKSLLKQYREAYDYLKKHEDHFFGDNIRRADYILAELSLALNDCNCTDGDKIVEFFNAWHTKKMYYFV